MLHLCESVFDHYGCLLKALCVTYPEECPPDVYDHKGCRKYAEPSCADNEQTCPSLYDAMGCLESAFCLSNDPNCDCPGQVNDENGCPLDLTNPDCDPDTHISCQRGLFIYQLYFLFLVGPHISVP